MNKNATTGTSTPRRRRSSPSPGLLSASFLEPRIAVVLEIPKSWRPWLFFCRLLSICPAIYWGIQPALELFIRVMLALPWSALLEALGADPLTMDVMVPGEPICPASPRSMGPFLSGAPPGTRLPGSSRRYPWTEMALGVIWCGSSGYLSFFFADCLMSRWLINYTPQATIIRLLTINCANAFLTERILFFAGGFDDGRLLLPGWISIASTLTVLYHITQRKINIQKETSTSINVFSIASFVSTVTLLGHLHTSNPEYPDSLLLQFVRMIRTHWAHMAGESGFRDGRGGGSFVATSKCDL
ncbi:hypothetical protein SODALDRAFT_271453 [Sodiomyces alkalinus F11]|uniref:N-glycosylation protein EOS1 n=1 Tax=Sodiomyces alkalinus (strain CBS 110278 / VKM F-3762 / F11) TaxID=1314773 RepID=A0A3N2Q4T3_SODAK|nr:hypothetical protein SODALDRAFT_271453 [Sodiomyces alkalinus F11]ROT41707.1 hypothetical protein SODALDRAFT_271453 [Sodiomyces alkalinus F11]